MVKKVNTARYQSPFKYLKPFDSFCTWLKGTQRGNVATRYEYLEHLEEMLKVIEWELVDLGHIVELMELTDEEKVSFYDQMKLLYQKRRLVKQELLVYEKLRDQHLDLVDDYQVSVKVIDQLAHEISDPGNYYRLRQPEETDKVLTAVVGYPLKTDYLWDQMTTTDLDSRLDNEYAKQLADAGYESSYFRDRLPDKVKSIRGARSFNARLEQVLHERKD